MQLKLVSFHINSFNPTFVVQLNIKNSSLKLQNSEGPFNSNSFLDIKQFPDLIQPVNCTIAKEESRQFNEQVSYKALGNEVQLIFVTNYR